MPRLDKRHHRPRLAMAALFALGLATYLFGIRRDLPYTPHIDEGVWIEPAVRMVATGSWNPRWFGHPGSTVIYPLTILLRIWQSLAHGGPLFGANPEVAARFQETPARFYLLGRLLSATYAAASLPLLCLAGQRLLGRMQGWLGAWLCLLVPMTVSWVQLLRSDGASMFFAVLALYACLRLCARPGPMSQVWAGLAIGLGISTKYYLGAMAGALLLADLCLLRRYRTERSGTRAGQMARWASESALGLGVAALTFALTTPYFFLDWPTARAHLLGEMRSTHLGADGLSPIGNLLWYLGRAIPDSIGWLRYGLALGGAVLLLARRGSGTCGGEVLVLLAQPLFLLLGISSSALHWQRWLIPALPALSLVAAEPLAALWEGRLLPGALQRCHQRLLALALVALVSAQPAAEIVVAGLQQARPSTRVLARQWLMESLPPSSRLVQEWYTAPLEGSGLEVLEVQTVASRPLEEYAREGYAIVVVSSYMYERYLAEPDRYPDQVFAYERLFTQGELLVAFEPSKTTGGPTIRVYRLPEGGPQPPAAGE